MLIFDKKSLQWRKKDASTCKSIQKIRADCAASALRASVTETMPLRISACPTVRSHKFISRAIAEVEAPPSPSPKQDLRGYAEAVLMQGFGWESCLKGSWYNHLSSLVDDLSSLGVTHLWLPPPSQSVSPQGYMPGQLYNLNSKYGNQSQLVELNKKLKAAGISPLADIVINHRCADEMSDGVYNKFRDDVNHKGRRVDWGKWAITSNDPIFRGQGNPDTGEDFGPAPDLDHANPELRSALREWLSWLQTDIGFDGWRLDFVKGYAAKFTKEYIGATTGEKALNVGEYWVDMRWSGSELESNQDHARQALCNWIENSGGCSCLFDFPTKGILQEAVKKVQYWRLKDNRGKAPGLLGWMPKKAVTFVDNHDTGSSQRHWPFPDDHVAAGYAYILTHPGVPCLFIEHWASWGPELRASLTALVRIRQRNKLRYDSTLEILCADADMYVARIDKKVVLKMGPRFDMGSYYPRPEDGWKLAASGKDFAIWDKTAA